MLRFYCFSSLNYDEWVGGQRMVGDISFQKMYVCEDVLLSLCCWRAEFCNLTKLCVAIFHSFFRINATDRKRGLERTLLPLSPSPLALPPFSFWSLFPQIRGEVFFFAAQVDPAWEGLDSLSSVRAPILSLHCIRIRFLAIIKS